jgi:hypothetical protein
MVKKTWTDLEWKGLEYFWVGKGWKIWLELESNGLDKWAGIFE